MIDSVDLAQFLADGCCLFAVAEGKSDFSLRLAKMLAEFGVSHLEMPATPERVWRAIHGRPDRSRTVP